MKRSRACLARCFCLQGALPIALALSCSRAPEPRDRERPSSSALATGTASAPISAPRFDAGNLELLYLPDGGDSAQFGAAPELVPGMAAASSRCPAEMVDVRGRFCIDRYEAMLVDQQQGRRLSPYYHPTRAQTAASFKDWSRGTQGARLAVPPPPDFQLSEDFEPRAESHPSVTPSGYLSGNLAELACRNAGKRLCTLEEWVLACRGQGGRKFPYGDQYQEGRCNVFREAHPAQILHHDSSSGHLDPRLNLVESENGPLLRKTGATESCKSTWGSDAIYDMVGNLDEWVDAPVGAFLGGFYARGTREGCDSKVSSHPRSYFDYSLGTRCCR
ncbi:MAG TPA: SUMF1/EgtB/PvdO family nonheme iron enzyme [Polyangiaceae bacterium]|nr:SUMF1/EgtB/PvdO family nonheme iron enzyme [Polyangiaceae bacterium]